MTRKGLMEGILRINHAGQICDACLLGKHSRTPFLNQAKFRSKNPLDLVYGDLCGPISPATHSGNKFIFLLVDDCIRFMWAYFRTSKDQAFSTFKEFRQQIEMEMRMKLRMLRTNRGGEFTSNEFTKYCKENGIARQLTTPYSLQQNGVVERRNRTVVPARALVDKTPYETLYNRKPNLENLRIFGCTAYAKDNNGKETSTQDTFWPSFVVEGVDNENPTPVNTENNDNTYQEHEPITDPDSPITPPAYTYNPNSEEEEEATISLLINSENQFDDTPVRGLKWVFKTKRDAKGKIIKYKARLVAKGYVQEQGIDFDEVSAPVARIETVHLILALAAYRGWQGKSTSSLALYSLRQAPRAWNMKLDQTLKSLDFKKYSTPDRFIQIVASIEQTNDLDDITLDEIVGKLKAFEERIKLRKGGQVESQENLLFAHGEHSKRGGRFVNRGGTDFRPLSLDIFLHDTVVSLPCH
nr:zinc finger, CCHC-type [Tanacetum cinerariifolium]